MTRKLSLATMGGCILLFLALAAAACSSSDDGGSSGTDGDADTPGNGATDGDLSGGDGTVDGDQIPTDGDKGGGGGTIITPDGDSDSYQPECVSDRNCYGQDYCDTDLGQCKRRKMLCEPCTTHEECGIEEDLCLAEGVCGWNCDYEACPDGFRCDTVAGSAYQQCVFVTSDGAEGSPCCRDTDCQEPQVCSGLTQKCYPGCSQTSGCAGGEVCIDLASDNRNGHCTAGCLEKEDCQGGEVCIDGACIEGDCANKEHCPIEYLCEVASHQCKPGCEDDADCYAVNECIQGACKERVGCEGTFQCSLAQMCTIESDTPDVAPEDRGCCFNPKTEGTEECPNPSTPQKFCDACTDTQNQNNECGTDNVCVELKDDDNQSKGYFCMIKWDCTAYSEEGAKDEGTMVCPRGYTCVKIESDNLNGKFCIADCTRPEFQ